MLLSLVAFVLFDFVGLVHSLGADACDKLPSWTITDLKIKSRDEVGRNGTASFTFTNSLTGKSDTLTCALVANYRCEIDGTPSDEAVKINLQAQIDVIYVFISKALSCDGGAEKLVLGNADLEMNCTSVPFGDTSCTMDSGTIQGTLQE